ncbi:MAG: AcrR family transcriptional regulator [Bermanella sp.]|jgi:AcrR family transcriptional regulator
MSIRRAASNKRDHILEAALNLFIEQGFEKTPTSNISKAANVATGTLFHHFKTKEELISTLYLEIKLDLQSELFISINSKVISDSKSMSKKFIRETFSNVWFSMISWMLLNPSKFKFLVQFSDSAHINGKTRERVEDAFSEWKVLFEMGQKIDVFNKLPADLLLGLVTSHVFTTCNFLLENSSLWQQDSIRLSLFESCWAQVAPSKDSVKIK